MCLLLVCVSVRLPVFFFCKLLYISAQNSLEAQEAVHAGSFVCTRWPLWSATVPKLP